MLRFASGGLQELLQARQVQWFDGLDQFPDGCFFAGMIAQPARLLYRAQIVAPLLQPLHHQHLFGLLQRLGQSEHVERGGVAHGAQQFFTFLAAQFLVEPCGLQRRKTGKRQRFGGVLDALLRKPACGGRGMGADSANGRQRLRMVGSSCCGLCDTKMNSKPGGGSSRLFNSAFAALAFIASAGWMMTTRLPP